MSTVVLVVHLRNVVIQYLIIYVSKTIMAVQLLSSLTYECLLKHMCMVREINHDTIT